MIPEILKKSGYRIETTDEKIAIKSSRRPREFVFAFFLTLLIGYAVAHAGLSDNLLLRSVQYLIYMVLIVGPFLLLFFQWTRRIEVQTGRVRITGTIKGEINNSHILTIDIKTEPSTINKRVTILVNDSDKGLNRLFVVYVKPKDMEELNNFVNQIRKTIGLKNNT